MKNYCCPECGMTCPEDTLYYEHKEWCNHGKMLEAEADKVILSLKQSFAQSILKQNV